MDHLVNSVKLEPPETQDTVAIQDPRESRDLPARLESEALVVVMERLGLEV